MPLQAALRDPWILESFTPGAVRVIRELVQRYRPGSSGAAAAADGAAAEIAGGGDGSCEPTSAVPVLDSQRGTVHANARDSAEAEVAAVRPRGGGAAAQRKLLELLTQIDSRVGKSTGTAQQVCTVSSSSGSDLRCSASLQTLRTGRHRGRTVPHDNHILLLAMKSAEYLHLAALVGRMCAWFEFA